MRLARRVRALERRREEDARFPDPDTEEIAREGRRLEAEVQSRKKMLRAMAVLLWRMVGEEARAAAVERGAGDAYEESGRALEAVDAMDPTRREACFRAMRRGADAALAYVEGEELSAEERKRWRPRP